MMTKTKIFTVVLICLVLLFVNHQNSKAGDDIWTTTGPYGMEIWSFAGDPNHAQIMYAGTDRGLYQSADGGNTWNSISAPSAPVYSIAVNPNDSQIIYLATMGGVFVSTNGGNSWAGPKVNDSIMSMVIAPSNSQILYAASFHVNTIYKSIDGGNTWETFTVTPTWASFRAIAVDPNDSQVIYVAGIGIYKSTDGGISWVSLNMDSLNFSSLSVRTDNSQIIYAGVLHGGLFLSVNGGLSWTPVGNLGSLDVRDVIADPVNLGRVYVGVYGNNAGVYVSLDNGQNWTSLSSGIGSRDILTVFVDSYTPQSIYAGTTNSGIWKYTRISESQDYSVSINQGALYTNATSVTLSLTAPVNTMEMMISNDGGFAEATWEAFASTKPWSITSYGSYVIPRIVYVKFKTNGENSSMYQDDIVLDIVAPTGGIEIIDTTKFSSPTFIGPYEATGTLTNTLYLPLAVRVFRAGYVPVALRLYAIDDASGVSQVLISTDPNFAGAVWETFSVNKKWWVPIGNTTSIYVKYRDRAGNESIHYFDTVTVP